MIDGNKEAYLVCFNEGKFVVSSETLCDFAFTAPGRAADNEDMRRVHSLCHAVD